MLRAQVVVCLWFFKWLGRRNNGQPDSRCSRIDHKEQPIFHKVELHTPFIKPLHMWHNNWWVHYALRTLDLVKSRRSAKACCWWWWWWRSTLPATDNMARSMWTQQTREPLTENNHAVLQSVTVQPKGVGCRSELAAGQSPQNVKYLVLNYLLLWSCLVQRKSGFISV